MKKTLFLLLTVAILASALGIQVSTARAEGTITYEGASYVHGKGFVFIFAGEGYRNKQLKEASIYIGSDFYDLFCWVAEDKEYIICNAQSILLPFSHQIGIIYLSGYMFYVELPGAGSPSEDVVPTCGLGEVLGANYMVDFGFGYEGPYFVPGDTLAEADLLASSWFSDNDYYRVSGLICDVEPS